ncbi:MAG: CDP-archaeol synthase [Acidimicrobiales bacterium]
MFEPPPEEETSSFAKIPIIRDDADDSLDLTDIEFVEAKAAAEVEAAGLKHWTEPPADEDLDEGLAGPTWRSDDDATWVGADLADVFADTAAITHERVIRLDDEDAGPPPPLRRQAISERSLGEASVFDQAPRTGRLRSPADAAPGGVGSRLAPADRPSRQSPADVAPVRPRPSTPRPAPRPAPARVTDPAVRPADGAPAPARMTDPAARPAASGEARRAPRPTPRPAPETESATVRRGAHDLPPDDQPRLMGGSPEELTSPVPAVTPHRRAARPAAAPPPAHGERQVGPGVLQRPDIDDFGHDGDEFYDDYDDDELAQRRGFGQRLVVGLALAGLVFGTLYLGEVPTVVLIGFLSLLAVMELFNAMRVAGLRPATLLGLVGTVALPAAAYVRGDAGFPLVIGLAVVFGMLWYLTGADTERPVLNLGLTLTGILWIGGLAGFGALMVRAEGGIGLLLATILITATSDTLAYLGGRAYGTKAFHAASPSKTWEGTITGFFGAILAGLVIAVTDVIPVFGADFLSPLILAAVVGVLAPIGDLAESLVKRDLGIKDMGTILPGHGGILDRVDGLLFALPGAYYVAVLLHLI